MNVMIQRHVELVSMSFSKLCPSEKGMSLKNYKSHLLTYCIHLFNNKYFVVVIQR